jgi:hypothetical protein
MTDIEPTDEEIPAEPPPHPAWSVANGYGTSYECPECAKQETVTVFATPQALGLHRRKAHGVVGTSARSKARKDKREKQECPHCHKSYLHLARHIRDVHEKVQAASDLAADDIFWTVVSMLYPGGQVPVQALQPLMVWKDQTAALLDTLISS